MSECYNDWRDYVPITGCQWLAGARAGARRIEEAAEPARRLIEMTLAGDYLGASAVVAEWGVPRAEQALRAVPWRVTQAQADKLRQAFINRQAALRKLESKMRVAQIPFAPDPQLEELLSRVTAALGPAAVPQPKFGAALEVAAIWGGVKFALVIVTILYIVRVINERLAAYQPLIEAQAEELRGQTTCLTDPACRSTLEEVEKARVEARSIGHANGNPVAGWAGALDAAAKAIPWVVGGILVIQAAPLLGALSSTLAGMLRRRNN